MSETFKVKRGSEVGGNSNVEKNRATRLLKAAYSVDFQTAVHTSLETIKDLLMEKPKETEVNILTRQLELLMVEQAERLEAVNRDLEAFNYSVAHDLCAPLRRISGFTRALQERYGGSMDPEGLDYLERIFKSSQQMSAQIEALLQLSQVSHQSLKREMVDLSKIVSVIASDLSKSMPERRAEFAIQPHIRTIGDANLLEIALKNLLRNAWKFTSRRDTTRIEFGTREMAEDMTCFLRDNGVGFDLAHSDRMFHAFQRLHNGADFPGNGVGLTMVQRIITRHGGRIWAEGEVDKGATFYFILHPCIA